ncbi:MAG TPA: DNA-directed RNA polymerase subunit beta', partial [Clostridiales bacterium]|nr:DNA-directed RNA polymerase subunit beta' [Clostridiales bacterium]
DFDGDQMAVHVPLSAEAQAEARFLMLSANNLLKPQDGSPVTVPTQDMVLGSYYLTIDRDTEKGAGLVFSSPNEAVLAYENHYVGLHAPIKVRITAQVKGRSMTRIINATVGRLLFNEAIPQNLGFVDRSKPEEQLNLECNFLVGRKELAKIIGACIKTHGTAKTAEMLDRIKTLGFKYSTRGAVTIGVSDMVVPELKQRYLAETEEKIDRITEEYKMGNISEDERYELVIKAWSKTTENVTEALMANLDRFNPVYMMSNSGARGNIKQISQLAGMIGLKNNTMNRTIDIPVKSNFREGLKVLEFFIATHGARKGLTDTALKTADSGYLTRRLVEVSQDVIVREPDCGTDAGIDVGDIRFGKMVIETLEDRLRGRYAADDVICPATGEVLVLANQMITDAIAKKITRANIDKVKIRSVLTCRSRLGVCAHCYGANLATGEECNVGEAAGIIAAQSIGEPGTQLTMRTFHTGGVAGADITEGLPRVEELFEARKPKGLAIITDIAGTVSISETKKKKEVIITALKKETPDMSEESSAHVTMNYLIPYGATIKVKEGDVVEPGDELTEGSVNPHDILKIKGLRGVQSYLIQEVQRVYRMQGVDLNDKHIEVIVRQMLRKVKIEEVGDTNLLPGALVDIFELEDENERVRALGLREATSKRTLLGITKATLATDSFLSAASFQETTRVLTDAAIKGKIDPLVGLKENVILGKLIPAGTGMKKYKDITVVTGDAVEKTEEEMQAMSEGSEKQQSSAGARPVRRKIKAAKAV